MVFWAGILAGGFFIWIAVKIGFYETFAILFNIVISIYVAIFLTPIILDIVPAAGETQFCNALALIVIAAGTFLILFGLTYILLTSQYKVSFPKIFDILFSGALGFLTGFLILSFIVFIITVTPISQNRFVKQIGLDRKSQQANISYICWWCDLVNRFVSSPESKITTEEAIDKLINCVQIKEQDKTGEETGTRTPAESNEPTTSNSRPDSR
ncbi:MAG: CvpA family protein [Phycisphaerales bacterium]|jgi:uncharacterized membrane protein required for colicin V production